MVNHFLFQTHAWSEWKYKDMDSTEPKIWIPLGKAYVDQILLPLKNAWCV